MTAVTNPAENKVQASANPATSLIARMAERLQVDSGKLWATMTKTCFKPDSQGRFFSNEEVMYVLMVAEQLGINPLRREIWAFRGKDGSVQPIVSIDGWKAIMLRQTNFDGYQVKYSDTTVKIDGLGTVPEWAECTIWLKNVAHPTVERVFMQEVYVPRSPVWNKSPRLMLHHRALIQAIRFSFPVTGISDVGVSEEGEIIEVEDIAAGRVYAQASPAVRKPAAKPVAFDRNNLDKVAANAVAMARKCGDYAPAFKFAEQLRPEDRAYVTQIIEAARDRDQLDAISAEEDVSDEVTAQETAA